MTTDFKASQVQTNRVIVTGSFAGGDANQLLVYSIEADDSLNPNQGQIDASVFDTSAGIGTDVFFFVSGGISQKDVGGSYGVSVFGGDVHISGNLTVGGTGGVEGTSGDNYWASSFSDSIFSTGSVLIRSDDGSETERASDYGSDIFFYVSGSQGGRGVGGVSVFGGDVVVSGTLYAERQVIEVDEVANSSLYVSGNLIVSESAEFKSELIVTGAAAPTLRVDPDETGPSVNIGALGTDVQLLVNGMDLTQYSGSVVVPAGSSDDYTILDLGAHIGNDTYGMFNIDVFAGTLGSVLEASSTGAWKFFITINKKTDGLQVVGVTQLESHAFVGSTSGDDPSQWGVDVTLGGTVIVNTKSYTSLQDVSFGAVITKLSVLDTLNGHMLR